jgi:hypothetical protein
MILIFGFLRAKLMTCDDNPMSTDIARIQKIFIFLFGMFHDRAHISGGIGEPGRIRTFSPTAPDFFFIRVDIADALLENHSFGDKPIPRGFQIIWRNSR